MKKILMMTTGGTIASAQTALGLIPALDGEELLSYLPDMSSLCELETLEISSIDSTNMTCSIWIKLVETIRDNYDEYDGFVICHGTDTLAYTAAALSYMIQNSTKPIVVTGSQKPITFDSTDAKVNLTDSILYALDEESRGVQIVFNGKVITGTRGKKTMSVSYQAFSSINFPFLATIQFGRIVRYIPQPAYDKPVEFYTQMNERVFLLKLTPCTTDDIIAEIFKLYDCVIVESFGVGGLPDRLVDTVAACINAYPRGKKILIITTQVIHEGSHISIYEVGKSLRDRMPYLESRDMNLETILAKIMWILGTGRGEMSFEEIEKLFYDPVEYDVLG